VSRRLKVMRSMCATCPFREGSPYSDLAEYLAFAAMSEGSRVCHSTGSNAINKNTGKPERICRGARNSQIQKLHRIGFLPAATDAAWDAKCKELGIL
jgi:hypothetical protein